MSIPQNDLNTQRSPNQSTDLWLGVYNPPIVLQAQINDPTILKGASTIIYDNVITGTYLNVSVGMSCYIGSTPGNDDLGRCRIRGIATGTIEVSLDKSIDFADNQYLTIRDFYEIWSVFPRATISPTNIITYYKDFDVPYSDQNSNFNPTTVMGGHYFGFLNNGNVYFTATGSYNVDGSPIDSYSWQFPNHFSITGSTSGSPGNISVDSTGFYTAKCTVSSNGKIHTGSRHISLFNRPGISADNLPISDWELKDLTSDFESGWTAKIEVGERADEFKDGYLVGLWTEDFYNGTKQSFGGYPGREGVLFVGYINKAQTFYNAFTSRTTFYIKGTVTLLENKEMFSVSLEHNPSPSDWTQIKNMTFKKILDHYLRWHTTLLNVADFININTVQGDYPEQYEDITKGEILSNINNMMKSRLFAAMSSDRQGRVIVEVDLNMLPTGTRPSSAMTFIDEDWLDNPKFDELIDPPLSNVLLGGVSFDFPTNSGSAYLSRAPGISPAYVGKSQSLSGLTLTTQAELNILSGLYFGKINNRINNFSQDMAVDIRNIDIIPQQYYNRNLLELSTFRKIIWNNKRFIPRKITYKFKNGSLLPNIIFEAESNGTPGETIEIPVVAPRTTRPRSVPVRTTRPVQPGTSPIKGTDGGTVYVATQNRLGRTRNFNSISPNWTNVLGSITGTIKDFILDPWNPKDKAWCITDTNIWRCINLDSASPTWISALSSSQASALTGNPFTTGDVFCRVIANITQKDLVYCNFYNGTADSLFMLKSINGGITWTVRSLGAGSGAFNLLNQQAMAVGQHNPNVIFQATRAPSHPFNPGVYVSNDGNSSYALMHDFNTCCYIYDLHTPYTDNPLDQVVYCLFNANNDATSILYRSLNQGISWTDITPSGFNPVSLTSRQKPFMIHSYTQDRNIIAVANGGGLWLSLNAGNSWTLKSTFGDSAAFGGFPYNGGQFYRLEHGVAPKVSFDGGATWANKLGDWLSTVGSFNNGVMITPVWTLDSR